MRTEEVAAATAKRVPLAPVVPVTSPLRSSLQSPNPDALEITIRSPGVHSQTLAADDEGEFGADNAGFRSANSEFDGFEFS